MKNYLLFLLVAIASLTSCQMARFDRIPGAYLDIVPSEIQGTYKFYGKDFRSSRTDTLEIQITDLNIQLISPKENRKLVVHQDFQVYRLNHLFVIARNDETTHGLWNLFILEGKDNGLRVYPVFENKEPASNESVLNRYLSFHDIILNHDPIQATPNPGDGSVSVATTLGNQPDNIRYFQVSDEQVFNYFEQELRDKEYIFLKATKKLAASKIQDKVKVAEPKKKKK